MSSKKKLNAKNILILVISSQLLAVIIGFSISYIWQWEALWAIAGVNLLLNTPLALACSDAIRQEFGLRSPAQITGNWTKRALDRQIPINSGDQRKDIFMNILALPSGSQETEIVELETISVWYDNNNYTITMPDIEEFIYVAWRRQTQLKSAFSRNYWTKQRRPRMKTLQYKLMMLALESCNGLISDRNERRSGKLNLRPDDTIKIIKNTY